MIKVCASSVKITAASTDVTTTNSLLVGAVLYCGSNASSITFENGDGGTELAFIGDGGTTAGKQKFLEFPKPVVFGSGIHVDLAGTAAYCYIFYEQMTA